MQHIENLPKGLDPELVKQTQRGKGWGAEDQARYDAALAKRGDAKERAGKFKPPAESEGAYRPAVQSAQIIVDLLENLPATHSVQRLAPPLLPVSVIEPWGQTSQIDRPFVLANEPAGHALHSDIPSFPA